jgi:hypothetical protein
LIGLLLVFALWRCIGVKFAQSSSQWEEKGTISEEMSQTLLPNKNQGNLS